MPPRGGVGRQSAQLRHSWAQRAKACGYPQRFAQEALGHSSRAVPEAYARGAVVVCPALDEYESKIIPWRLEPLQFAKEALR